LTRKTASTGRKERKEKPPAGELTAPPSPLPDLHLFAFSKKNQKEEQEEGEKKDRKCRQLGNLRHKPKCLSSRHCYSKSGTNKMRGAGGERGGNREGEEGREEGGRRTRTDPMVPICRWSQSNGQ
jgi:hypothetical protein